MIDIEKGNNMKKQLFDENFLKRQKSFLLSEKQRLINELASDSKFPEYGDTEEDNASEVTDFTEKKGIEKKLKGELVDVKIALDKIDNNLYGMCEECKKQIEKARLEAMPSAKTCITHSNKRIK